MLYIFKIYTTFYFVLYNYLGVIMAREDKTQYAILGALQYGAFSGYELKKMINNTIGFFWSENYGRIYPVLGILEKKDFVKKLIVKQEKKPSKHVYTLTDTGRKYFLKWLDKPAEFEKIRHELLLKIFFGNFSTDESNREKLAAEVKFHSDLLERYAAIEKIMSGENQPISGTQEGLQTTKPDKAQTGPIPDAQAGGVLTEPQTKASGECQNQQFAQPQDGAKYMEMTLGFGKHYSSMSIEWCRKIMETLAHTGESPSGK
jgi:PadR family transcriptional regulator, regulatory protein AphA